MDDIERYDGGIDEGDLGYEGADAERVRNRAMHPDEREEKRGSDLKRAAGAVGAAAVLAATMGTASVDVDKAALPEPVPIVQTFDLGSDVPAPDAVIDEDASDEKRSSRWEFLLKILKYLIVLIAAIVALVFALLKGCIGSCAAPLVDDDDEERQEQVEARLAKDDWIALVDSGGNEYAV